MATSPVVTDVIEAKRAASERFQWRETAVGRDRERERDSTTLQRKKRSAQKSLTPRNIYVIGLFCNYFDRVRESGTLIDGPGTN